MAPFVKPPLPLLTTRTAFETNILTPLPVITLRTSFGKTIRNRDQARRPATPYTRRRRSAEHTYAGSRVSTPMGDDESVREESSETEDEQDEQVEGGKIAKPPGEAGRSRSGGFNLEEALDWEHNKYKKLTTWVNSMIKEKLDGAKCFSKQDQKILQELIQTGVRKFNIEEMYMRDWPVREAFKQRLKYYAEQSKKKLRADMEKNLKKAVKDSAAVQPDRS